MPVQRDLISYPSAQARRRGGEGCRPRHRRAALVRTDSGAAPCAQSATRSSATEYGTNPAHRLGGLRDLPWCNDLAYRDILDRRGPSLLHLLHVCPEGKDGMQGTIDPNG